MIFLPNNFLKFLIVLYILNPVFIKAGTTGKIVGNIIDEKTNEALIGVNVEIENANTGASTDLEGNYFIIGIHPDKYTITASYISYKTIRITNVEINIDKTTTINFEMQESTLELGETIEVIAERPLIKRDLTSTESTLNRELIEVLPLESLGAIVNLQAGVVDGHFRGGRSDEVLYMVNGVSVNDAYSGSNAIDIENNAIQEVNIISGTFNAEYGQAMSGVVNVVTRDGGESYMGSISGYLGSYYTGHDDIFWNKSALNLTSNLQGTISGPIPFLGNKLSFFASGRYIDYSGYIYGRKVFLPPDHTEDFLLEDNPNERQFESRGKTYQFSEELAQKLIDDADNISMNSSTRYSSNMKVTYQVSPGDKINLEGVYQNQKWRDYDHRFRLNPDGSYKFSQWSMTSTLSWNHVFGPSTFMDNHISYFYTSFKQDVYDDPYDNRYVVKERLQDTGSNAFLSGGQQMWHFDRNTTTKIIKSELTSQITFNHQIKAGIEGRQHKLWMHEFEVIPEANIRIAPLTSFQNNSYLHYPSEISGYVQDKMEFEDLIINAGLRFDYFIPDGKIPEDFLRPDSLLKRNAKTSSQLSPRLGLAYPISATGAIHASYGHFFQIPSFNYLYTNPEFDIDPLQDSPSPPPQSVKNTVGNAELKPQRTTIYEIGLQQQLGDLYGISLTVYFKDIRNLLGTEVLKTLNGIRYGRYINRDYGYVRGVTLEFERKYTNNLAASIDYTFQVANGNASDPNNAFLDAESGNETEKQVVPLDWDRQHQLNASITFGRPENFVFSVISSYGTGFPYTPSSRTVQPLVENGGRKPDEFNVDIYITKDFKFNDFIYSIFIRVYNLFDGLNERDVYSDTGRAGYSTEPLYSGGNRPRGLNTLEQYYIRPNFYSEPRQVQLGLEVKF